MRILLIALSMIAASTGWSLAQDQYAGPDDRFMISKVEGGVLRIDRQSGAVSLCKRDRGEWSCELVPDDRDAMLREIEELRRDNRYLRRQLARIDPEFEDRGRYGFERGRRESDDGIPDKKEIDKAMDSLEYMMERLLGAADRFGYGETPR